MENYYELLGVSEDASRDEIKEAYREKAKENHPDKGGDNQSMKKLNKAKKTLLDKEKRKKYDRNLGGRSEKTSNSKDQTFNNDDSKYQDSTPSNRSDKQSRRKKRRRRRRSRRKERRNSSGSDSNSSKHSGNNTNSSSEDTSHNTDDEYKGGVHGFFFDNPRILVWIRFFIASVVLLVSSYYFDVFSGDISATMFAAVMGFGVFGSIVVYTNLYVRYRKPNYKDLYSGYIDPGTPEIRNLVFPVLLLVLTSAAYMNGGLAMGYAIFVKFTGFILYGVIIGFLTWFMSSMAVDLVFDSWSEKWKKRLVWTITVLMVVGMVLTYFSEGWRALDSFQGYIFEAPAGAWVGDKVVMFSGIPVNVGAVVDHGLAVLLVLFTLYTVRCMAYVVRDFVSIQNRLYGVSLDLIYYTVPAVLLSGVMVGYLGGLDRIPLSDVLFESLGVDGAGAEYNPFNLSFRSSLWLIYGWVMSGIVLQYIYHYDIQMVSSRFRGSVSWLFMEYHRIKNSIYRRLLKFPILNRILQRYS